MEMGNLGFAQLVLHLTLVQHDLTVLPSLFWNGNAMICTMYELCNLLLSFDL